MYTIFILLFFFSLLALIVGLVKPGLILSRFKDEEDINRKNVAKYVVPLILISFILSVALVPDSDEPEEVVVSEEEEVEEGDGAKEEGEVVEEFEKMLENDREDLNKPLDEILKLDYNRLHNLVYLIDNKEDYSEEDQELISKHEDEIKEEYSIKKEAKGEEERIAREEQEAKEEERKKREEEEAKAEAEKYETGITFEDIARDKDGLFGEYVRFSGRVIQVLPGEESVQCRVATSGRNDNVILVEIYDDKLEQNILEDDNITIEGMSMGNITYETVMGADREIPFILVENVYQ